MMLCIDGSEIASLTFAFAVRKERALQITRHVTLPRRLGDELAVLEEFLRGEGVAPSHIQEFGLVCGPGSAGALRSTLSLVNTFALVLEKDVIAVCRDGECWSCDGYPKPYVLPVYDRPVHVTPSHKDALGRRI
jgi:tRNA A37 threonylcarbamoyladenosine modification protein TsaB